MEKTNVIKLKYLRTEPRRSSERQHREQKLRNRSRKRCWMYKEEQHDKKNSNAQRNRGFCG